MFQRLGPAFGLRDHVPQVPQRDLEIAGNYGET